MWNVFWCVVGLVAGFAVGIIYESLHIAIQLRRAHILPKHRPALRGRLQ